MALNKLRNAVGRRAVIPRSFGVNDQGRSMTANAQTANLGSITRFLARAEIVLLDLLFQGFPGGESFFGCAAVRPRAEQDVPMIRTNPELGRHGFELLFFSSHKQFPSQAVWCCAFDARIDRRTRRAISPKSKTDAVPTKMQSQSKGDNGSTRKILPTKGTLMMMACTIATVPAINRNVGLFWMPLRPLDSGVRERQLIWFHTWKKT